LSKRRAPLVRLPQLVKVQEAAYVEGGVFHGLP
jgi:hypothetical protein